MSNFFSLEDWKNMAITQEYFAVVKDRVDGIKEELAASAGVDPLQDRFKAGYLQACRDFLDVELE